jgi:arginyl-tRNA synthetase
MDIKAQIQTALAQALAAAFPGADLPSGSEIQLTPPRQKEHGDLATNIAMSLAKRLGQPPRGIAEAIAERLRDHDVVECADVAGPGFLNITLRRGAAAGVLRRIAEEADRFGRSEGGKGVRVNVEFVSANPTGPLHVGHARGAVVGDTVARLLDATGHEVTREFYFNDAGVQMDLLGRSLRARVMQQLGQDEPVPEEGYHGEYLIPVAEKWVSEFNESDELPESGSDFIVFGAEEIMGWIKRDLHDLGIDFDIFTLERTIHESGAVERSLDKLRERDMLDEREGATFLRSEQFGDEKDRVVIKGDGNYTYLAPDIAYHEDKFERGFDRLIDVFGADHHGYVPRLRAAIQALGHSVGQLEIIIIQMVNILKGGEVQRLGKRLGNFITLRTMIDELGADVVRWFFLMRSADSDMTFDWELAQDHSDRNPVYKVQYAHARICSVFTQAGNRGIAFGGIGSADLDLLNADEEQALLKHLPLFPEAVARAAETLGPHQITTYLLDLANLYNAYQTLGRKDGQFRILRADAPAETQVRLALIHGVRQVLANGLALLGLSAPERM